ncbi:methyl-accepting chemotaxis protein [Vibrio mangrovi]|uniref:Methyl-accepting chemotaxis protein n=1 Tax=Vibrio mangrovi TaxID=474394 RepID=A0ABU4IA84_9VIBR|nr:methyl-accepting chemotaxis protein [Vibrio mangrovi]MDW6004880.1 methyl-accepting chemotaxis protein [Vibrio mangrovi]
MSILAGIPLVIALIFAISNILEMSKQVDLTKQDKETVRFILLFDNLAHNLAVERGLTAGVLGSKGKGAQVEALQKQRLVVNQQINNLRQFTPQFLPGHLAEKLRSDVNEQLNQLRNVRQQVDSLKPTLSPFDYYSHINQIAIDNGQMLLESINSPEIANIGGALIAIVTMKERAGQVRGALNGAFARKSSSPAQYAAINQYIRSGTYADRSAMIMMPPEASQALEKVKQSSAWKEVETIQQKYLAQQDHLEQLDGPQPSEWFSLATSRIKLLNQIRNQLQETIQANTSHHEQQMLSYKRVLLVATLVIGSIMLLLLGMCIHSLKSRVGQLTRQLEQMSSNQDLTIELTQEGNDEVAQVARSTQTMAQQVKALLKDVQQMNLQSTEKLMRVVDSSIDLEKSSLETIKKCEVIATAATELSQSSVEIATSSERALDETSHMTNQLTLCREQSQTSFSTVENLVQQIEQTQICMQDLEKDSQSISQIVEAITAISEQTNLLALNAAIEAARAGEHGRGFAVVSTEVRDLAQRSKEATEQISQLLGNMGQNTAQAVNNMNQSQVATKETFESVSAVNHSVAELGSVITSVNEHIMTITNSTLEQSKASESVNLDINLLAEIAQKTGSLAQNMEDIASHYKSDVEQVTLKLNTFRV